MTGIAIEIIPTEKDYLNTQDKRKRVVTPPSLNTCCHSLDMDKIKVARPGKPGLIDTNVPRLPFKKPSNIPGWLDLAILGT